MLARMKTLEEGFAEVVREFRGHANSGEKFGGEREFGWCGWGWWGGRGMDHEVMGQDEEITPEDHVLKRYDEGELVVMWVCCWVLLLAFVGVVGISVVCLIERLRHCFVVYPHSVFVCCYIPIHASSFSKPGNFLPSKAITQHAW